MSRQLPNQVNFKCTDCSDKAPLVLADKDAILAVLQLCQAHQDARFARGMKAKLELEAKEKRDAH